MSTENGKRTWHRRLVGLTDVLGRDHDPPRVRVNMDLLDSASILIDHLPCLRSPAPPLRAGEGPKAPLSSAHAFQTSRQQRDADGEVGFLARCHPEKSMTIFRSVVVR
ncbi:hypothetical protein B0H03_10366 [Rathayibacter iranicus NCPPB 2253 = VKM Ac-1602]|uniref:Uncharacterized protein n=1 Tax=Rathayibacter iranicus NCPPB 2253 = VKM Ac-1602 TaxID=1328868 RepID=A0ABX5LDV3_9MICO|nr:hypothetical protein B0H03_10366 [Rathayibacter iranicus NCPPB 2253 = VKM Ac-1602]